MESINKQRPLSCDFERALAALPEDLTGVNLAPLYCLVSDSEKEALKRLEHTWQPNIHRLGTSYNGPIGENGKVMGDNYSKWQFAVRQVERTSAAIQEKKATPDTRTVPDEVQQLLETARFGDTPIGLYDAAKALAMLADDESKSGEYDWEQCTSSHDIEAIHICLSLIRNALPKIEAKASKWTAVSIDYLQADLARVEAAQGR